MTSNANSVAQELRGQLHKVQEKVNIDEEIKKIERRDKKRKRDNSEEDD
jgi:hypothetical protein